MSFKLLFRAQALMTASALALAATSLAAQEVVDPATGETVELSEIDFATLSRADARDIAGQLRDAGYTGQEARAAIRDERREDIGALEVVDPTTGETVALSEIDKDSLSAEDRADIGDQLAEQGVEPGRPGRGGKGEGRGGRGGDRGGPDDGGEDASDT